jgi:hypothetical protein
MELLEQLELVDVTFEDKRALLVFLDEERGEIREVTFNKQVFDQSNNKFIDDDEKAEKVEQWSQEIFGLPFNRLAEAIGERKDVYAYDRFNSLFPIDIIAKFDKDMVGQIMEVEVSEVVDDGKAIFIKFEYDGDTYASKMQYADYLETKKQWFINPVKQKKQYEKFEDKFSISIEDKDELVGQRVMIEIKLAFGTHVYVEVKPFPKKKKK